jgi:hypothetical protein
MNVTIAIKRRLRDVEIVRKIKAVVDGEYSSTDDTPEIFKAASFPIGEKDFLHLEQGIYTTDDRKFYRIDNDPAFVELTENDEIIENGKTYIVMKDSDRKQYGEFIIYYCKLKRN